MKLRCVLKIYPSGTATNAEIVKKIKDEAKSRMNDIQRMCNRFTGGTVKFRYGDFNGYETTKEFKSDWIMYRRALDDVFDCDLEQISLDYDATLRPRTIIAELYLQGE